ncbi:hypothetical protein [Streptomyces sp.]|uniref:hypothetical protein n=1 Tax=Streptomyces sp. TaxID=1931 RepID=UPI0028114D43|nr:hypothetical protein [Streptomyces sp.]
MARNLAGAGRVTIFPLLHDWETRSRCVLAYTSMDDGYVAVVGVIPVEGNVHEPGDLFALAGRHGFIGEWKGSHEQRCGCWLISTGTGALRVPKPGTVTVEAAWSLDMVKSVDLETAYAGHTRIAAGRMTFEDQELEQRARALISVPA